MLVELDPAIRSVSSETHDPFVGVEAGRTLSDGTGEDTIAFSTTKKGK